MAVVGSVSVSVSAVTIASALTAEVEATCPRAAPAGEGEGEGEHLLVALNESGSEADPDLRLDLDLDQESTVMSGGQHSHHAAIMVQCAHTHAATAHSRHSTGVKARVSEAVAALRLGQKSGPLPLPGAVMLVLVEAGTVPQHALRFPLATLVVHLLCEMRVVHFRHPVMTDRCPHPVTLAAHHCQHATSVLLHRIGTSGAVVAVAVGTRRVTAIGSPRALAATSSPRRRLCLVGACRAATTADPSRVPLAAAWHRHQRTAVLRLSEVELEEEQEDGVTMGRGLARAKAGDGAAVGTRRGGGIVRSKRRMACRWPCGAIRHSRRSAWHRSAKCSCGGNSRTCDGAVSLRWGWDGGRKKRGEGKGTKDEQRRVGREDER